MASLSLPARRNLDGLLLDAGGVLVDPDWSRIASVLARCGVHVPAARLAAAEPAAKKRVDRRESVETTDDTRRAFIYYELVLEGAGHATPVAPEVWEAVREEHTRCNFWRVVPPGVPEALGRLRDSGLRLAVVSNANGTVHALLEDVGLASYFDTILDSHREGVEKPHPEIFRRALERLDVAPGRALHAGDLYEVDVVGARKAGAHAALIDVAGLYEDADCPRFRSLPDLVRALLD